MNKPTITDLVDSMTPIDGGWCIKTLADQSACIDVLVMMFNYRVVLAPRDLGSDAHPTMYNRGYCYFGHGVDNAGQPRTMRAALLAAVAAGLEWDGTGDPLGYDKRVL